MIVARYQVSAEPLAPGEPKKAVAELRPPKDTSVGKLAPSSDESLSVIAVRVCCKKHATSRINVR
jgi:hypothetical protein